MNEKLVTIIVSDLHLGGGAADPGDDHVYQNAEFSTFIQEQKNTKEGQSGDIELIINGDFLEFAQVRPDVYTLGSSKYWCSVDESLQKLEAILSGHANVFGALKEFQTCGNSVTIAAGNHDVDLYWDRVRKRLQEEIGSVRFELGTPWYSRYDGRLQIAHGHMFDPANKFKKWDDPILIGPGETPRLEMCAGTLFMVKFVNWLEKEYPFADNIKPITALGRLLWREDRVGLLVVAWMLSKFMALHPSASLGSKESVPNIGDRLTKMIIHNQGFREEVTRLYRKTRDVAATPQAVEASLNTEEAIFDFFCELIPKVSPEDWLPVFDVPGPVTLGIGANASPTLSIVSAAGKMDEKESLKNEAKCKLYSDRVEVVVLGHTHQPDEERDGDGGYFNPGSWTRYVEINQANALTLEDLKREEDFPYQLNYIQVKKHPNGVLRADKMCYKKVQGSKGA